MSIRIRRGTAASAAANNPILADGEIAIETDTGVLKVGDGTTAWTGLSPVLKSTFGRRIPQPWAGMQLTPGDYSLAAGALVQATLSQAEGYVALWMEDDQSLIGRSLSKTTLGWSTDEGATWTAHSKVWNGGITAVHGIDNGEIIVCTNAATTDGKATIWLSSGWATDHATAVFTAVQSAVGPKNGTFRPFGLDAFGEIVLAAEYGEKVDTTNMARYVFMSTDYGQTWSTIFDWADYSTGTNAHLHGVAFDPWWDAIWVTGGDSTGNVGTYVSFDRGKTWDRVPLDHQVTAIMVLPNCVLLTTDAGGPNGIYRISRTSPKNLYVDLAYTIDAGATLSHYGMMAFRARRIPGAPALLAFHAGGVVAGPAIVIATHDGHAFREIWRDTTTYTNTGLMSMVGPTASGKYLGQLSRDVDYTAANTYLITLDPVVPPEPYPGTMRRKMRTGCYYATTAHYALSTPSIGKDVLRVTPFEVPERVTLSSIGMEVTTAGDAGSILRAVIYADDGTGQPGMLVYDGTLAGDAVTAAVENAISLTLEPGLYWAGGATQNWTTTAPVARGYLAPQVITPVVPLTIGATPGSAVAQPLGYAGVISPAGGAAPATFPSPNVTTTAPRVFVKVA